MDNTEASVVLIVWHSISHTIFYAGVELPPLDLRLWRDGRRNIRVLQEWQAPGGRSETLFHPFMIIFRVLFARLNSMSISACNLVDFF